MYAYQVKIYRRKTGETREETRMRERKTEKICELCIFGGTSNFNIIVGRLDLNILVRRLETRSFVLQV